MSHDVETSLRRAYGDLRPDPATEAALLEALGDAPRDAARPRPLLRFVPLAAAGTLLMLGAALWLASVGRSARRPAGQPAGPDLRAALVRLAAGDVFEVRDAGGVATAQGVLGGTDRREQADALARLGAALAREPGDRVVLEVDPAASTGAVQWVLQAIARLERSVVIGDGRGAPLPYEFPRDLGIGSPISAAVRIGLRRVDGATHVRLGGREAWAGGEFVLGPGDDADAVRTILQHVRGSPGAAPGGDVEVSVLPPSGYEVPGGDLLRIWRILHEAGCRVLLTGRVPPDAK